MFTRAPCLLLTTLLLVGCSANSRKIKLQNEAAFAAESHGLWTRPSEVGFKMGDPITSSAVSTRILGFNVGEAKNARTFLGLTAIEGSGARLSATGEFAAYKAVSEANADGIYVTRVETDSQGVLVFWKTETVTVYGRALILTDYGAVDEARADEWRFRAYGPDTVIIKDNNTDVNVGVSRPPAKVKP